MARGCSGSDSDEEERHDRFKSERNQASSVKPTFRTLPSSLDDYSSRSKSHPSRNDKSRSKNSSESFLFRRDRSKERKRSRERKSSRERDRNSGSSEEKKYKNSSHDKDKKCDSNSKKLREKDENIAVSFKEKDYKCKGKDRKTRSKEKESKNLDTHRRRESRDDKNNKFEKVSSNSDSDYLKDDEIVEKDCYNEVENHTLPRYYEIVDECADSEGSHPKTSPGEKCSRKHKRSRDKSQNHHESKKRKKDKKHKRKHDKKKSEDDSNVVNTSTDENTSLPNDVIILDNESDDKNLDANTENSKKSESEHEEGEISGSESEQYFGPALPPGKVSEKKMIGPSAITDEDQYGPALPPATTSAGDEAMEVEEQQGGGDIIGPLPLGQESYAQAALDIRASLLKRQMDNKVSYEKKAIQKLPALPFHNTSVSLGTCGPFLYWLLPIAPNSLVWSFLPTFGFFITFFSVPRFGNF